MIKYRVECMKQQLLSIGPQTLQGCGSQERKTTESYIAITWLPAWRHIFGMRYKEAVLKQSRWEMLKEFKETALTGSYKVEF